MSEPLVVSYEAPPFHRRVVANLMDILIFALLFVAFFIPTNAITKATPEYIKSNEIVNTTREQCGFYVYEPSTKTYLAYPTYFDNYSSDSSGYVKANTCAKAIDDFIAYVGDKKGDNYQAEIQRAYDDYRLGLKYNNEPYFIKVDGVVISNKYSETDTEKTCRASNEEYYKNVYHIFILQDCAGYLISWFPEYKAATSSMSNMLFFIEIPVSYILSGLVTYLLPMLIFKRGGKTFGKLAFRIGLINNELFSPSTGKIIVRFLIFFFGEMVLSLFTFGIPFIVSFSMMAFSKRKQGFPDYMLGLIEVDTSKNNIYFNKYEASVYQFDGNKKSISFHMREQK